jgi:coenzyme F420 biosynthesis associated uncharacterized protein
VDAIDWEVAQWIGELVAGHPSDGGPPGENVAELTESFARRVSTYSGLAAPERLPPLEAVDRPSWIAANLNTMRPLLEPLAARGLSGRGLAGWSSRTRAGRPVEPPLGRALRAASGLLLGAQVGALTGVLSQRVLGQYDIELFNATSAPRLLLVSPNLSQAARNLHVDRDQLTTWVAIHEVTHAVQFAGASWLQGHLAGLMRELIERMEVTATASDVLQSLRRDGLRSLIERLRRGEVLRLTLGEGRWAIVARLQAAMSLIEGHAEHVMDAVGADVLPSLPRLREAMTRRRENRGMPWRVLERLLGIELKMRQYEVGRRFCDAVVEQQGPLALARAFSAPDALPTGAELEQPALWLARTSTA